MFRQVGSFLAIRTHAGIALYSVVAVALIMSGCSVVSRSSSDAANGKASSPATATAQISEGITKPEATELFKRLEAWRGDGLDAKRDALERATGQSVDLKKLGVAALEHDVLKGLSTVNPAIGKNPRSYAGATSPPDRSEPLPFYAQFDESERSRVAREIADSSQAELFDTAWQIAALSEEEANGSGPPVIYDIFREAIEPIEARAYRIRVAGPQLVAVDFDHSKNLRDWTTTYKVEKQDGSWRIVAIDSFGEDLVAEEKALKEKRAAAPPQSEILKRFGRGTGVRPTKVVWMGRDKSGNWWAVAQQRIEMKMPGSDYKRVETYSILGRRSADGSWTTTVPGTRGGDVQLDGEFKVPSEVEAALKDHAVGIYRP